MEQSRTIGIINRASKYSVKETLDRLEYILESRGMVIFARIDQKAAAEAVGLSMRSTELLIFGDPKGGTHLMNLYPSLAIDLPLKALAAETEDGHVIVSYNSSEYLKKRHNLKDIPFKTMELLIEESTE